MSTLELKGSIYETIAKVNDSSLLRQLHELISEIISTNPVRSIKPIGSKKSKNISASLNDEDWVRPGRPATGEEMEQLVNKMENEKNGITTKLLRLRMQQWKAKKSA